MRQLVVLLVLAALTFGSACSSDNPDAKYAVIETEFGDMRVMLYNTTPLHRDNFLKLAEQGYYNDLLFHRVVSGFMIQGGDPDSKGAPNDKILGEGGPGYTLHAEIGAPHFKGALAAARTGDEVNPTRASSGSQFYIVQGGPVPTDMLELVASGRGLRYNKAQQELYKTLGGTPELDGQYTVFGEVVEGLHLIDSIAAQKVNALGRPAVDIPMRVRLD